MTTNEKASRSASKQARQVCTAARDGSGAHTMSAASAARRVSSTSERIIKETSVKRRKAMEMLANR